MKFVINLLQIKCFNEKDKILDISHLESSHFNSSLPEPLPSTLLKLQTIRCTGARVIVLKCKSVHGASLSKANHCSASHNG